MGKGLFGHDGREGERRVLVIGLKIGVSHQNGQELEIYLPSYVICERNTDRRKQVVI